MPQIVLITPLDQYFYFLDRNNNLSQVVYPDGHRFKYGYDLKFQGGDIHNFTAITDTAKLANISIRILNTVFIDVC